MKSHGQLPPVPSELRMALDANVEYVNAVVKGLEYVQGDLEAMNIAANKYLDKETTIEPICTTTDPSKNKAVFPVSADALFNKLVNGNDNVPADLRGKLNIQLGKFKSTWDELIENRNFLAKYLSEKQYLKDPKAEEFYKKMKRCDVLFYDIKILEMKIGWELDETLNRFSELSATEKEKKIVTTSDDIVKAARNMFKALYDDRKQDFTAAYTRLKTLTNELKALNSEDAVPVIAGAKSFDQVYADYNNASYKQTAHSEYGRNYFFHNDRLLPLFSSANIGLVAKVNSLKEKIGNYNLLSMTEPPIFERKLPKLLKDQEEPPMPTADEMMKIIEAKQKELETTKKEPVKPVEVPVGTATLQGFADNNLVLLLDVSSSMNQDEKLPLLKSSLLYLLDLMRPEDNISIVVYSGEAKVLLPPTSAANKTLIKKAIADIKSAGQSEINDGIKLAYKTVQENFITNGNNRIILATDGKFEISPKARRTVNDNAEKDIFLSIFYFGMTEPKTTRLLLTELADAGRGRYAYIKQENHQKALLIEAQAVRRK